MITLVSPSFLKQEAKKLKQSLGISHHEALDRASNKYGFSNFRHFLNFLEKSKPVKDVLFKKISLNNDMPKIEISHLENSQISFEEQLDILKLYQNSDDIQSTCKKWNLMNNEMQSTLFNEFLTEQGENEIHFRHPHFIAKAISLSDLEYEMLEDTLCVDGVYDLKIKLNCDEEEFDLYNVEPHFRERELSGSFGVEIDRHKIITIPHLSIVQIIDGMVYAGTLKPTAKLMQPYRLNSF